ncbi:tyrosine-type recombinase/integrase [Brachybacterium alimentarium]|uniref:tyrosine-type recombinase/integrase n=1 Tax=Brachybacterium alimentarium TaxID=47845 RepID=UPI00403DBDA6
MKLDVFAESWLARINVAPRTRYSYRTTLMRDILPTLGDRQLAAITERIVRDWYYAMPADRPAKRAQAYRVLRTVLNAAVDQGELTVNPCRIKGAATSKVKKEAQPLTVDELHALAAAMPDGLGVAVYVGAFAALRAGEVLGLQRQDVDLGRRVLRIRRSAGGGTPGEGRVGQTKTEASRRDVAIPTFLADALAIHMAAVVGQERSAWLFPSPALAEAPVSYGTYYEHMRRAAQEIGRPDVRTHDLRHAGAVMAARSGATVRELMHRLGHTDPKIAMRYQHATAERDRSIADDLDRTARQESD